MATIYLALGSNMGNRRAHLVQALRALQQIADIERISSLYETDPVGYVDQAQFYNLVCQGQTTLSAPKLLQATKAIERAIGRQQTFRNGPRPIDIDILLYDQLQLSLGDLVIPHPRMSERAFVLLPFAEIAPNAIEPKSGQSIQELAIQLSAQGIKKLANQQAIKLEQDLGKQHKVEFDIE